MASMSSSSSATVRVEKATSQFLMGPDWTLNIDICDTINSNQMLAKDIMKAVKKRLQNKNPKVQLLALTLLETMVKNCGDYVHFQIAERDILPEMVKIVKKKKVHSRTKLELWLTLLDNRPSPLTDMHVRFKILTLIGSWYKAFGGSGGKHPQYYMAYEELRRTGVQFSRLPPDAAPIFTPPVTHPISKHSQTGYGMPSSSSTGVEVMEKDNLSLSSINSMRNVLDLLADMLQAVDPSNRSAVKNEVIIDLVEQCHVNQRKLMQLLGTTGDEELLGQGLELNDSLQRVLVKHDAIASGSPLPPEVTNMTHRAPEKHDSSLESVAEDSTHTTTSNVAPSAPVFPCHKGVIDEEDEEKDDFAQLARRRSKTRTGIPNNTSIVKSDVAHSEAPSSPAVSNALVLIDMPSSVGTKDENIIDLLSITLSSTSTSAGETSQAFTSPSHTQGHVPSTSPGITFSSEAYPLNSGLSFNSYIAPWAQPQQNQSLPSQLEHPTAPRFQPQPQQYLQAQPLYKVHLASPSHIICPGQLQSQPSLRPQPELYPRQPYPQFPQCTSKFSPSPWAATPGYLSCQNPVSRSSYSTPRPTSLSNTYAINGEAQFNTSPRPAAANSGQKPFIPSYRLFEDLDVFGNTGGRSKSTNNASPSLSGSNHQNMVGGRK